MLGSRGEDGENALDPKVIHCAAGLVLRDGKILLGLRAPDSKTYPNVWDVFGGHVEPGETVEQALRRELGEELDITPIGFQLIARHVEPDPARNGRCLYHFFKVTAWRGPGPRLCGAEHSEIRWYGLDEALALDLAAPQYRAMFKQHLAV